MRSRVDAVSGARRVVRSAALAAALIAPASGLAAQDVSAPPTPTLATAPTGGAPSNQDLERALEVVRADPQLAPMRTIKTLRWRPSPTPRRAGQRPGWMSWIGDLFLFIGESTRIVIWGALIVLVAMVAAYFVHTIRRRAAAGATGSFVAPTHVRDLDIRPETLPDDIGSAARTLWDRGDHRAALALLYRGLLSRLVHVHQVPIRHSSTEGDCLTLAQVLPGDRRAFVASLVTIWQRAVYGREPIATADIYRLCDGFAPSLDPAGTIRRGAWQAPS